MKILTLLWSCLSWLPELWRKGLQMADDFTISMRLTVGARNLSLRGRLSWQHTRQCIGMCRRKQSDRRSSLSFLNVLWATLPCTVHCLMPMDTSSQEYQHSPINTNTNVFVYINHCACNFFNEFLVFITFFSYNVLTKCIVVSPFSKIVLWYVTCVETLQTFKWPTFTYVNIHKKHT